MMEMNTEEFEALVADELDQLPTTMLKGLDNVVFVVEDAPKTGDVAGHAAGSLNLLGLYHGTALTRRGTYGFGELPDRIVLYRLPILAHSEDLAALRKQIHITLVHEIGHFYGLDDERLHELGWG